MPSVNAFILVTNASGNVFFYNHTAGTGQPVLGQPTGSPASQPATAK